MKDLIKDVHENGVKSDYKEPKLYDVVPKEEIAEFEEVMREIIADIVSEASGRLLSGYMCRNMLRSISPWMICYKIVGKQTSLSLLWIPGLKD